LTFVDIAIAAGVGVAVTGIAAGVGVAVTGIATCIAIAEGVGVGVAVTTGADSVVFLFAAAAAVLRGGISNI
jgi:hypothetical protein